MRSENERLTHDDLIRLLPNKVRIHTFRNPLHGILVGADWDRAEILRACEKHGAELSGPEATAMDHGIVVTDEKGPVFIETRGRR